MTFNQALGTAIKEQREREGITREQLAEMIGICSQTIYYYEVKDKSPTCETLLWISSALNMDPAELMFEAQAIFNRRNRLNAENESCFR